jgi:hypothetical protein
LTRILRDGMRWRQNGRLVITESLFEMNEDYWSIDRFDKNSTVWWRLWISFSLTNYCLLAISISSLFSKFARSFPESVCPEQWSWES